MRSPYPAQDERQLGALFITDDFALFPCKGRAHLCWKGARSPLICKRRAIARRLKTARHLIGVRRI